jgi:prepilin-type N-terminal cleavage/methylation domain-containing protein
MKNISISQMRSQKGFTLVEMIIVMAITAILAIIGVPLIQSYITQGKVEPTANDLRNGVAAMRKNFSQGSAPYSGLGSGAAATAVFANNLRGAATTMQVSGAGASATLQHTIGAAGSQVTVASTTLATAGDAYTVTLPTVSASACPDMAAIMARTAEVITINGTTVKSNAGAYNGAAASNLCTDGDTNNFIFTFR